MFRNMRLLGDIFNLFPLLGPRHLLCDFQNGKIQLDCRLGRFCREVVADERGQLMSRLRQLGRLFRAPSFSDCRASISCTIARTWA